MNKLPAAYRSRARTTVMSALHPGLSKHHQQTSTLPPWRIRLPMADQDSSHEVPDVGNDRLRELGRTFAVNGGSLRVEATT